jgi:hypothetical protein
MIRPFYKTKEALALLKPRQNKQKNSLGLDVGRLVGKTHLLLLIF